MKSLRSILFVLIVFSFMIGNGFTKEKTVEGIGLAAGTGEAAHEEALRKALRNAVERAVGVMVSSESLVKNFQLLEDHIYSNVQGYVKDYEIIEDNKGEEDITRIKVKATVEKSKLEDDLRGIKVILEAKGNPKTMVILNETIDSEPSSVITDIIEQFFMSKTFPMVDKSQLDIIKDKDALDLDRDPTKAKVLGSRFGAELILSGTAKASLGSEREAYGVPVFTYSGNLSVKAINSDTGDIIAVMSQSGNGHGGSPQDASQKALKEAWEAGRDTFFKNLMEKWRSSVLNYSEIILFVSKCSPKRRKKLKQELKTIGGIIKANEKSYSDGVCEFVLNVDGTVVKTLYEKIENVIKDLLLTSKTSNRIDFEVSES
ncbi:hypothetical protein BVX93_00490 [bacterium B13(2017)]|nr:hypothetical protein BVX93_00490 [bacterium B13(2017)]